jgi:RHS repeat-associated protein
VSKTDSAGTTNYLFDGDRVLADSRADYTLGGVTGLISERAGSTSKVYHGDQLSSTRGLSNGSQAITDAREYDAWGLTVAASGSTATPAGFVGGEGYQTDADSGIMLLGERYYDPSLGRFISRDPIRYEGGWNLYGYCHDDPVNSIDPTGESDDTVRDTSQTDVKKFESLKDMVKKQLDEMLKKHQGIWDEMLTKPPKKPLEGWKAMGKFNPKLSVQDSSYDVTLKYLHDPWQLVIKGQASKEPTLDRILILYNKKW